MANNSMTPAPETAALVERLLAMASDLRCTAASCHDQGSVLAVTNKAFALDLLSAASLLLHPEPQGTASERETAHRVVIEYQRRTMLNYTLLPDALEELIASALAGERERNAESCSYAARMAYANGDSHGDFLLRQCAAAIRAGERQGA